MIVRMKHILVMAAAAVLAFTSCTDLNPDSGTNSGQDTTDVTPKSIVVGICPSGMSSSTKGYYKRCINDAGGVMMVCENYCWTEAEAAAFVRKIDALISPGSTSGDADGTGLWPYKRGKSDNYIIAAAINAGKPVLGICYGHQHLNQVMGGGMASVASLAPGSNIQHKVVVNGSNIGVSTESHNINIDPESLLANLLGTTQVMVNTSHDYALSEVSPRLKVVARADDGIIEAVEGDNVMGVQFHPEYLYGKLGLERFRSIFDNLVMAAIKARDERNR